MIVFNNAALPFVELEIKAAGTFACGTDVRTLRQESALGPLGSSCAYSLSVIP
jgi:hypothetical protein